MATNTDTVSMGEKALMADPAPLGLAAFAFTTFLLSFANAGWLTPAGTVDVVIPLAIFYGGTMQVIAGAFEMRKGNTFGFTAFSSYGGFWLFFASLEILALLGIVHPSLSAIGAALLLWGIFTFYMWIPAMFANASLNLTFLTLWLAFVMLGLGDLYSTASYGPTLTQAGGYFGLGAAFFAAYTSFAIVTNSVVGAKTIPLGPSIRRKAA